MHFHSGHATCYTENRKTGKHRGVKKTKKPQNNKNKTSKPHNDMHAWRKGINKENLITAFEPKTNFFIFLHQMRSCAAQTPHLLILCLDVWFDDATCLSRPHFQGHLCWFVSQVLQLRNTLHWQVDLLPLNCSICSSVAPLLLQICQSKAMSART